MAKPSPEQADEDLRFNQALFGSVREGLPAGRAVEKLKDPGKLPEINHWRGYRSDLPACVERMACSIRHGT